MKSGRRLLLTAMQEAGFDARSMWCFTVLGYYIPEAWRAAYPDEVLQEWDEGMSVLSGIPEDVILQAIDAALRELENAESDSDQAVQ